MGDVVGFLHDWYVNTILYTFPLFTFRFIQHHFPRPVLSVPDSDTQP